MILKAVDIRKQYNEHGKAELVLTTDTKQLDESELKQIIEKGKELSVEIKQYRKKRSLDANAYCWVLCRKIADVIGSTDKEVYRAAVIDYGVIEIVPIKNEEVEDSIMRWNRQGLGAFAEVLSESKLSGYTNVRRYFGSSTYNTKDMSILIDGLVNDAKDLDIETMTPSEIARLKQEWGR